VKVRHFAILGAWTMLAMLFSGAALFFFTYGDCYDNEACERYSNRAAWTIIAISFIVYWVVFIALVWKWNRDVR